MKEKRRQLIQEWYSVCQNYRKSWLERKVRNYLETFRIANVGRSMPDQTKMYSQLVDIFGHLDVANEMVRQSRLRRCSI